MEREEVIIIHLEPDEEDNNKPKQEESSIPTILKIAGVKDKEDIPRHYKYYIGFHYIENGSVCIGCTDILVNDILRREEDLAAVAAGIEYELNIKDVVVMSWSKYQEEYTDGKE